MPDPTYICIDLKSFYASVECVERGLDPLTTNLAVADPDRGDKTICLAITPAMKALGIKNRCRIFEIPQGIDYIKAKPRMQLYIDYSAKIYEIYLKYISKEDIHVYSIDEVFMDVTHYLALYKMDAKALASRMIQEVFSATGITATAGIGTNLYLAKISMDIVAKHAAPDKNGVRIAALDEASYRALLWDHRPLTDFWRIGSGISKKLARYGLYTMGDIARASLESEEWLFKLFGIDAELLIDHAWGLESCTMPDIKRFRPRSSSISSGQVLYRDYTTAEARLIVQEMTDLLVLDLVAQKRTTLTVSLYIGYERHVTGQGIISHMGHYGLEPKPTHCSISLNTPTSSTKAIMAAMLRLYDENVIPSLRVRRVTIVFSNLSDVQSQPQMDLFTDHAALEREHNLQNAVLSIKNRFGKNAILKGMNFLPAATTRERNGQIGGHKA